MILFATVNAVRLSCNLCHWCKKKEFKCLFILSEDDKFLLSDWFVCQYHNVNSDKGPVYLIYLILTAYDKLHMYNNTFKFCERLQDSTVAVIECTLKYLKLEYFILWKIPHILYMYVNALLCPLYTYINS